MRYKYDDTPDKKGKGKHTHLLDLNDTGEFKKLTGTSSVVDVLGKPLSWWASGEAVKTLGWVHSKIKHNGREVGEVPAKDREKAANEILKLIKKENKTAYLARLDAAYKAHSVKLDQSAKAGTDLHAELERFVKWYMNGKAPSEETFSERIIPFIDWSINNVKEFIYSEANCFHEKLWLGGISDVGAILKEHVIETSDGQIEVPEGTRAIIDFKSSKEAYYSQFVQGGGYALQIEENGLFDADGNQTGKIDQPFDAVIIVPFGAEIVYPDLRMKADEYKEAFTHCLSLYRLMGKDKSDYNYGQKKT